MKKDKMIFKHMGKLIKDIRNESGLSQSQFATLLGQTAQNISNIERGVATLAIRHHREISEKTSTPIKRFKEAYLIDSGINYDIRTQKC